MKNLLGPFAGILGVGILVFACAALPGKNSKAEPGERQEGVVAHVVYLPDSDITVVGFVGGEGALLTGNHSDDVQPGHVCSIQVYRRGQEWQTVVTSN